MTADEIASYVIASGRLEGQTLSAETVAAVRRIASGDMSTQEIRTMKRDLVQRLRNDTTES